MTSTARSLLFVTSLYFVALGAVAAALYGGLSVLAPAVQAHFLHAAERPQSRLDLLVADAREIRQALATPIAPAEPLQPITAQPLRAMETKLEPEQKPEPEHRASSRRLEARNAYAMSRRTGYGSTTMGPDRYRPE